MFGFLCAPVYFCLGMWRIQGQRTHKGELGSFLERWPERGAKSALPTRTRWQRALLPGTLLQGRLPTQGKHSLPCTGCTGWWGHLASCPAISQARELSVGGPAALCRCLDVPSTYGGKGEALARQSRGGGCRIRAACFPLRLLEVSSDH